MDSRETADLPTIRRSFRCFQLGALGLIPGFGIALAWQSLQLFCEIEQRSESKSKNIFPVVLFVLLLIANPLLLLGYGWPMSGAAILVAVTTYLAWVWRQYWAIESLVWNPARHWAWAGAALARVGLASAVFLALTVYEFVYADQLLGAR